MSAEHFQPYRYIKTQPHPLCQQYAPPTPLSTDPLCLPTYQLIILIVILFCTMLQMLQEEVHLHLREIKDN